MPTVYGNVTRGLKDLKVAPYPTGAAVDVGAAIEATIIDRVDGGELKGDDVIVAVASKIEAATLKFTAGGITPEAVAVMTGKPVVESGTTPNRSKIIETGPLAFPYFRLFGKALGPNGDDQHIIVYRALLTSFSAGVLRNGEFQMTEAEGVCLPDPLNATQRFPDGKIYDQIFHETTTALPTS